MAPDCASGLEDFFKQFRARSIVVLPQKFFPGRVAMVRAGMLWFDHDFPLLMSSGAVLVGDLSHFHIVRHATVAAKISCDELLATVPD